MANAKEELERHVVRLATRSLDWEALGFQADVDPRYRRAQMRYLGGGGTGKHDDPNIHPAEHFTLSTMVLPAHSEGPLHVHHDVEEVFFVLQGELTFLWGGADLEEVVETTARARDMVFVPAGVYRGVRNDTDSEALMLVLLGSGRPELPTYPPGSPLTEARGRRG
jgi:mannose-6-phosphate isomerase-like protein (cupin superfamily)